MKIIVGDVGRILATFVIEEQLIKADLEAGDIEDVGEVHHLDGVLGIYLISDIISNKGR